MTRSLSVSLPDETPDASCFTIAEDTVYVGCVDGSCYVLYDVFVDT